MHIMRVHGAVLANSGALKVFDAAAHAEVDRLFPGLSAEGHAQAELGVAKGGLGWRKASSVARAANAAALVAAGPKVCELATAAEKAGLLPPGLVETRWREKLDGVARDFKE